MEKLKALKRGLKLINGMEKQMDLAESHKVGQIYTRGIPEKYFICKPCALPLEELDHFDLVMSFFDVLQPDGDETEMFEYGFLCEHNPSAASFYAFIEVSEPQVIKARVNNGDCVTKKIPAATYFCRQDENPQIENAHEIFKENLAGITSYITIETEILTSKSKIGKPLNELRLLCFQTNI